MTQEQALNILKTGMNVFLTGEPGSGKTHTVNAYVRWLKKHGVQPAITASTGIAATHIGGMTIHSFSGIGVADFLTDWEVDRIASIERINRRISSAKVLIIDEVSMLAAHTLQMVDRVFREARQSQMPFGGVQVILVGDFFQLPPVAKENKNVAYAFESEAWQALNPVTCYLTEQYRQDDQIFWEILSAVRSNRFNGKHHEIIATRKIDISTSPRQAPKLFSHNIDVDRINAEELAKLPGQAESFQMNSRGPKALVEQLKRGCLSPEILELKKNAQVMFTKNSREGLFVNGTIGIVAGFKKDGGLPIVKIKNGDKLTVEPMKWTTEEHGRVKAAIEQIPLRLAWAITVHKSQGMSLDAAVMDLSDTFEYGQGYVALSRVRRLAGLHLLGINQRALQVHPRILEKDKEFRENSAASESKLSSLSAELPQLHERFIKACGGQVKEAELAEEVVEIKRGYRDKSKRWEHTLELVQSGKSVAEVAVLRSRSVDTIYKHLEELRKLGKVQRERILHLAAGKEHMIDEINQAQNLLGAEKLSPVFEHFKGKYSYENIRLARLLYVSNSRE